MELLVKVLYDINEQLSALITIYHFDCTHVFAADESRFS
jgi:hypothetical protein